MAIRHIIAQGLGFAPGTTHWLVTHGFGSGAAPPTVYPILVGTITLSPALRATVDLNGDAL